MTFKSALCSALVLAHLTMLSAAQAPHRIVTRTRLVAQFDDLETQLMEALRLNDKTKIETLLSEEFQVFQPSAELIPREDWLAKESARGNTSDRMEQIAARDLGDYCAISFILQTSTGRYWIVDLWKKHGDGYQLTDRYSSRIGTSLPAKTKKAIRPTGKD